MRILFKARSVLEPYPLEMNPSIINEPKADFSVASMPLVFILLCLNVSIFPQELYLVMFHIVVSRDVQLEYMVIFHYR